MLKNEKSLIIRLKTNKNYLNHKYLLLNNIPMTSKKYHGPVTNMKIVVSSTTPKLIDNLQILFQYLNGLGYHQQNFFLTLLLYLLIKTIANMKLRKNMPDDL